MSGHWQSDAVKKLFQTILREIESATKRSNEPGKSFVCHGDLKRIWSDRQRISTLLQPDCPPKHQIDFIQDHMIIILSILVSIGATDCLTNFGSRLFDSNSGNAIVTDEGVPFEMNQLTFLDSEPALQWLFHEHQYRFKPVVIEITRGQRKQVIKNTRLRLPFEYRKRDIGVGGYGKVDLVGISARYIKEESGSIWDTVHEVACKTIEVPEHFDQEVDNLQILKESLTIHHRIMLHLATIEHGPDRYILLPYAQYGDLELFLHCGIGPKGKPEYDFDKYFSELRENSNTTSLLLSQCSSLGNALEWLHNGVKIEKTSKTVFCAHMDLKPANILIQHDPESAVGKWVISDFGISVLREEQKPLDPKFGSIGDYYSQFSELTAVNTRPKRPEGTYQAPEVKEAETVRNQASRLRPDQKGIGRKSDVWSFGCIFTDVLAFALGRDKLFSEFQSIRRARFFVEKSDQQHLEAPKSTTKQFQVNPSILEWLDHLCDDQIQTWVKCYVETIKNILIVDATKRPDATLLTKLISHVNEHVDYSLPTCSLLRANDPISPTTPDPSTPALGSPREEPNTMHHSSQSPLLGRSDSTPQDEIYKDTRTSHEDKRLPNRTASMASKASSGTDSSVSMHIIPTYAHGIMINPDVPRIPKTQKPLKLPRPGDSNYKASSISLTYSGNEVHAAYLDKSSIYLYTLNIENMSANLEPKRFNLPQPHEWRGIAVAGHFFAVWGFSNKKILLFCDIRKPQSWINFPSSESIEMLHKVAVSEQGAAALQYAEKIIVFNIESKDVSETLESQDDQKFTDAAFNDAGDLLFAWAYGKMNSLYIWKCQGCAVTEKLETNYNTVKKGKPFLTRVIPFNTYQGCIIAMPDIGFFPVVQVPVQVRSSGRRNSEPQPSGYPVNPKAVCMFSDHSIITVEGKSLREYKIEYGRNSYVQSSGKDICKLSKSSGNSSRLLAIKSINNTIVVIVCNLNATVEFVKIEPAQPVI